MYPDELPRIDPRPQPPTQLVSTLDPNSAEWFELAQLPGMGRSLARKITVFREAQQKIRGHATPLFASALDLSRVKGVGAKTVARIKPFLRFEKPDSRH